MTLDNDLVDLVGVRLGVEGERKLLEAVDDVADERLADVALDVVEDEPRATTLHPDCAERPDLVPEVHFAGNVTQQARFIQQVEVPAKIPVLDSGSRSYRHNSFLRSPVTFAARDPS